jgi:endonuclease/exonuclease/phosphatase (EEP) superfamily protein YafD
VVTVLAWIGVAAMVALVVTQLAGWSGRAIVAAGQALTPYVLAVGLPLAAVAVVTRRWALGAVCGAACVVLVALSWPLLFPPAQPAADRGASPLRVFHANLLYSNELDGDAVALFDGLDADVLTFSEYSPGHARALHASSLAARYPHRLEFPDRHGGLAIWSRYPLTERGMPGHPFRLIGAEVDAPDPLLLLVAHPPSPLVDLATWNDYLDRLAGIDLDQTVATLAIGDFNAAYWHPPFRDVLDGGWRDAHQLLGEGFSTSWPTDVDPLPPYVRLDHALVNEALVVADVADVDVPGADHRGMVVTVVRATG